MRNNIFLLNIFCILTILLSTHSTVNGQSGNLVPNGNFEDKIPDDNSCGTFGCGSFFNYPCHCCDNPPPSGSVKNPGMYIDGGQVELARWLNNWQPMLNQNGSPDYFNSCALYPNIADNNNNNDVSAGVPNNEYGYQQPRTPGNHGYGGFILYEPPTSHPYPYCEYLQVKLSSALVAGTKYKATMFVSLADNCEYACAGLGMLFTPNEVSGNGTSGYVTGYTPQVVSTTVITDTQNWIEISGIFTATGGEEWLQIGVFDPSLLNSKIVNASAPYQFSFAYYYIDDVSIIASGNSCCPDHQVYQNTSDLPYRTEVNNYIEAGSNIPGADPGAGSPGPVTVQNGQNVIFQAGNYIGLQSIFSVQRGSNFIAQIAPCQNWDLYPQTLYLINVPNDYIGCPCSNDFCITTQGADYYIFNVYDRWGNEIFSGSGNITSYITTTCIWNGIYNGSCNWPNPTDPLVYTLLIESTNSCSSPTSIFHKGGISPYLYCPGHRPINSNDTIKSERDSSNIMGEYPNPSNGTFTFAIQNLTNIYKLEIYNVLEQKVYTGILNSFNTKVDLSSQPSGVYLYRIINSSGSLIKSDRLIIQH